MEKLWKHDHHHLVVCEGEALFLQESGDDFSCLLDFFWKVLLALRLEIDEVLG